MVTLLMCLFIVLFAMSQVDTKKFAALASGLSASFGAPITALPGTTPQGSVLDSLPAPADIAQGIANGQQADQSQVDKAAAQAAVERAQNIGAEAQDAYDELAAARDKIDSALKTAGYGGGGPHEQGEGRLCGPQRTPGR